MEYSVRILPCLAHYNYKPVIIAHEFVLISTNLPRPRDVFETNHLADTLCGISEVRRCLLVRHGKHAKVKLLVPRFGFDLEAFIRHAAKLVKACLDLTGTSDLMEVNDIVLANHNSRPI